MTDHTNIEVPATTSTPSSTRTTATAAIKQAYPVRGVLWGIMFGIGLMIVTIVTKVIALSLVPALVVLILGTVLGTGWSMFGPAKPPKS